MDYNGHGAGVSVALNDGTQPRKDPFLRPRPRDRTESTSSVASDSADAFAERRRRLLAMARQRVFAWINEDVQDGPQVVSKLQVMNLVPSTRSIVPANSTVRSDPVLPSPGVARKRVTSATARFMAAHKSMYLSQRPIPSSTELLRFLDDIASESQPTVLMRALAGVSAVKAPIVQTEPESFTSPQPAEQGTAAGAGSGTDEDVDSGSNDGDTRSTDDDTNGPSTETQEPASPEREPTPPPEPLQPYQLFLQRFKEGNAADVVELHRAFLTSFRGLDFERLNEANAVDSDDDMAYYRKPESDSDEAEEDLTPPHERVRQFLTRVEGILRIHPVWRQDTHDPDLWGLTVDSLETFVMAKVHDSVFATCAKDVERDRELKLTIAGLKWIEFKHLDMPEISDNFGPAWELAQEALREMNSFKAVGHKVACIMNCCRVISTVLAVMSEDGAGVGADEFLPALIYNVIRANPDHLHSNLKFITDYCHPSKLMSEQGYFITNVMSAMTFVRRLEPSYLSNVTEEEFNAHMAKSRDHVSAVRVSLAQPTLKGLSFGDGALGAYAVVARRHGLNADGTPMAPAAEAATPTRMSPTVEESENSSEGSRSGSPTAASEASVSQASSDASSREGAGRPPLDPESSRARLGSRRESLAGVISSILNESDDDWSLSDDSDDDSAGTEANTASAAGSEAAAKDTEGNADHEEVAGAVPSPPPLPPAEPETADPETAAPPPPLATGDNVVDSPTDSQAAGESESKQSASRRSTTEVAAAVLTDCMGVADAVMYLAGEFGTAVPDEDMDATVSEYSMLAMYNYLGLLVGIPPVYKIPAASHCVTLDPYLAGSIVHPGEYVASTQDATEETPDTISDDVDDIDWATSSDEDAVPDKPVERWVADVADIDSLELPQVVTLLEEYQSAARNCEALLGDDE